MPHRKLVQIGKPAAPPSLPTVAQYFSDLSKRQAEDIRLLKQRAQDFADARSARQTKEKSVREDSWRLHPLVPTDNADRAATNSKKKSAKKTSAPRATKKRATKRAVPSRRKSRSR
jgi:hypothetical protein